MAKGRKAISDNDKRLRGTDQPCRMTESNLPATISGSSSLQTLPRSGLKGTAKKVYMIVGTELFNRGILDTLGLDLVIVYCREMGLYFFALYHYFVPSSFIAPVIGSKIT